MVVVVMSQFLLLYSTNLFDYVKKVPMPQRREMMSNINNAAKNVLSNREVAFEIDELERLPIDVSRSTKLNGHLIYNLVTREVVSLPPARKRCLAVQVTVVVATDLGKFIVAVLLKENFNGSKQVTKLLC